MSSTVTSVKKKQRSWAVDHGIVIDHSGYTFKLSDNLFVPLSAASHSEFSGGDGGELGVSNKRGKIQALHSSSALACNVFEYWRGRDNVVLAKALGLSADAVNIEFERKFPTGLPGNSPNLDVVLTTNDGSVTAIESKFLEPHGSRHAAGFRVKYFESDPGPWAMSGCSNCQKLAFRLQSGETAFRWLHAEQLLKHILGLARSGLRWKLLYLWYEAPDLAASEHTMEANEFALIAAADGITFQSMSYQTLFASMRSWAVDADSKYLSYLGGRYFDESI